MIIRGQDKKTITNFHQLTDVGIVKTDIAFAIRAYYPFSIDSEYSNMCLGLYSTEEKAIKVLDMIEDEFMSELRKHRVFQMPQDSEV